MNPTDVKTEHMRRLAEYRRSIIGAPPLRNLFLELTLRCNERCIHCGSRCGEHDRVPELSLELSTAGAEPPFSCPDPASFSPSSGV